MSLLGKKTLVDVIRTLEMKNSSSVTRGTSVLTKDRRGERHVKAGQGLAGRSHKPRMAWGYQKLEEQEGPPTGFLWGAQP